MKLSAAETEFLAKITEPFMTLFFMEFKLVNISEYE
jgi:hypothetical protein